jgi:hypothetical protein
MCEYKIVFERRYSHSKIGRASKSSMKVFKHLLNIFNDKQIKYFCGCEKNREYYLIGNDNKIYAYDLTIPSLKLIFEYHGKFWHSKTPTDKINELGVSLNYEKDQIKKELAIKSGFVIIELFEEDGLEYNIKTSIDELHKHIVS